MKSRDEPVDHVDRVRAQWAAQCPDLDTDPLAVVARVGRLARFFDQGHERFFAPHGLRRETWDVLACLRRTGPPFRLSPTQLYRSLMRTSGAITNRLRPLEDRGLVRRVPSDQDGRALLVELTDDGRELVDTLAPQHMDNERAMLAALGSGQRQVLAGLLHDLLVEFEGGTG
jgi:DNA-binding MarR family transcriptional regulator